METPPNRSGQKAKATESPRGQSFQSAPSNSSAQTAAAQSKATRTPSSALAEDGVSLFVHFPYCASKCKYCDFNSWAHQGEDFRPYLETVLLEAAKRADNLRPQTVFIGGGTPSLMGDDNLRFFLDSLNEITHFRNSAAEVSIEANPESFTDAFATAAIESGCNRLSLGVQSFQPNILQAYDRVHSADEAKRAFYSARKAGFSRINLDFIYAFPGQDPKQWEADLQEAARLDPEHLSCYELAYEPGTALTKLKQAGRWEPEDEDVCQALFESTENWLSGLGYTRYEISNYAKPREECLHNLASWRSLDYIGLGTGAASWRNGIRSKNILDPRVYQKRPFEQSESEARLPEEALFDLMLMGLRLPQQGVSRKRALRQTGLDPAEYWCELFNQFKSNGWLEIKADCIRTTPRGLLLLDTILGQMLPEV